MDKCPHCGVKLDARLVAAIRNPNMAESCPKQRAEKETPFSDESARLRTLALAARILQGGLP